MLTFKKICDQCMTLKSHAWVKETFKVEGRPMGFNVTWYINSSLV